MNVSLDCACGSTLSIDDASELATADVLAGWHRVHGEHRHTLEEYVENLRYMARRIDAVADADPGRAENWR